MNEWCCSLVDKRQVVMIKRKRAVGYDGVSTGCQGGLQEEPTGERTFWRRQPLSRNLEDEQELIAWQTYETLAHLSKYISVSVMKIIGNIYQALSMGHTLC